MNGPRQIYYNPPGMVQGLISGKIVLAFGYLDATDSNEFEGVDVSLCIR